MDNSTPKKEPARITLDELFRKTFSNFLASLMDTFNIFEEQVTQKNAQEKSNS